MVCIWVYNLSEDLYECFLNFRANNKSKYGKIITIGVENDGFSAKIKKNDYVLLGYNDSNNIFKLYGHGRVESKTNNQTKIHCFNNSKMNRFVITFSKLIILDKNKILPFEKIILICKNELEKHTIYSSFKYNYGNGNTIRKIHTKQYENTTEIIMQKIQKLIKNDGIIDTIIDVRKFSKRDNTIEEQDNFYKNLNKEEDIDKNENEDEDEDDYFSHYTIDQNRYLHDNFDYDNNFQPGGSLFSSEELQIMHSSDEQKNYNYDNKDNLIINNNNKIFEYDNNNENVEIDDSGSVEIDDSENGEIDDSESGGIDDSDNYEDENEDDDIIKINSDYEDDDDYCNKKDFNDSDTDSNKTNIDDSDDDSDDNSDDDSDDNSSSYSDEEIRDSSDLEVESLDSEGNEITYLDDYLREQIYIDTVFDDDTKYCMIPIMVRPCSIFKQELKTIKNKKKHFFNHYKECDRCTVTNNNNYSFNGMVKRSIIEYITVKTLTKDFKQAYQAYNSVSKHIEIDKKGPYIRVYDIKIPNYLHKGNLLISWVREANI